MNKKIKVYLAVLNHGWIRREILHKLVSKAWKTKGAEVVLEDPKKTWMHPISSNRNAIVKRFLQTDCDYLFMLDDDVVPMFNPIYFVFANKDIIGFPAKVRSTVGYINWVAYIKNPERDDYAPVDFTRVADDIELLKIDAVGTGAILIKRKVLETLKAPFHTEFDEDGVLTIGTDFAFCRKAAKEGFEIYTTPQRVCEHYKEIGLLQVNTYSDTDGTDVAAIKYGIPWGGFAINPIEWDFIKRIILEKKIGYVLEFGAGLSSLLISEMVPVLSLETDVEWADKIRSLGTKNNDLDIKIWDSKLNPYPNGSDVGMPLLRNMVLTFIDGPRGGENREMAYKIASELCDHIICHDAQREYEAKWQKKYLQGKFKLKARSGYYQACCHYWERI